MSHSNIALFIPHRGCPHQCSFCNQHQITGRQHQPRGEDVIHAVETALAKGRPDPDHTEIAFFGGSFTAVERSYQTELLSAAAPYVRQGVVRGIRISTRPDAVDGEILQFLKGYGVTAIELGAQSMQDEVLRINGRGHTAAQVEQAARLIREMGFSLGLQMMTGLPVDTADGAKETAKKLAALQPDTMRIYPTIVMAGTDLAAWYQAGDYTPMELEEAVALCSELLDFFEEQGIKVIRLGLHDTEELAQNRLAGPYHPAFAELCHSRRFLQKLTVCLEKQSVSKGDLQVAVHPRCLSQSIGQGKRNLAALEQLGYRCKFYGDPAVFPQAFRIEKKER